MSSLTRWRGRRSWVACFFILTPACSNPHPHERVNQPPQGDTDRTSSISDFYVYMSDNALMAERLVTDLHFLPQSDQLSGLGETRLGRYTELMKHDGGMLHYLPSTADEDLIARRLETIRSYLHECMGDAEGVDGINVNTGLAEATAPDARNLILVRLGGEQGYLVGTFGYAGRIPLERPMYVGAGAAAPSGR